MCKSFEQAQTSKVIWHLLDLVFLIWNLSRYFVLKCFDTCYWYIKIYVCDSKKDEPVSLKITIRIFK